MSEISATFIYIWGGLSLCMMFYIVAQVAEMVATLHKIQKAVENSN